MPDHLSPRAIIFIRVSGAMVFFWLIHHLFVKERVSRKDLLKLAFCSLFGVALNQIMFFEGLNKTTEINASLIMTVNPIMVLIFSNLLLKERISLFRVLGIILGMSGTSLLILTKGELSFSSNLFTGNMLILVNTSSFGVYLVLAKPLIMKYKPFTIMKWIFFFGFIIIFPFTIQKVLESDFTIIPLSIWFSILYVVLGATIIGYLLYNFALQRLSPVVASFYMYLQPLIASISVIIIGRDFLSETQIISGLLIFIGVYFVSYQRKNIK